MTPDILCIELDSLRLVIWPKVATGVSFTSPNFIPARSTPLDGREWILSLREPAGPTEAVSVRRAIIISHAAVPPFPLQAKSRKRGLMPQRVGQP